jgi:hypothetical protein
MSDQKDDAVEVLRAVWAADGTAEVDLEELRPAKACKNMKHVSFDGMADPGSDLRDAWRDRLEREGKLNKSGGTIRDLVFGTSAAQSLSTHSTS